MSSFQKTAESKFKISGTKLKNNLAYVSSGIPSLDHIIGGGIPIGTLFLVEEDVLGSYSRVLSKYFLAEGVVSKHGLLIASADENPVNIVKELPQPCTEPVDDNVIPPPKDEMKIAWRYEDLGKVESSFGANTTFGHHFDLSKHIHEKTINKANITFCHLISEEKKFKGFKNCMYLNLLNFIKNTISKNEYKNANNEHRNVLRICIQSLGSPIWTAMDSNDVYDCSSHQYGKDILKFIYSLRVILRDTCAVAFLSIPTHLFEDGQLLQRIHYSADIAVRLESFAGSSKETNPAYKEYHGLFHIKKLSALYSLVSYIPPSLDLAFKLKRKKFVIEKLHLPPELQESKEREQDDITAVPVACGGYKKKDIDF